MRSLLALLAVLLLSAPAGAAGPSDGEVPAAAAHWNAIGRLNRETGGFCTAVLVAADQVATAAHCLWDRKQGVLLPPEALHFVAGYRRGTWVAHARGRAFRTDPRLSLDSAGRPSELVHDWAIVTLDRDLPTGPDLAPIRLATSAERRELARPASLRHAGYGVDRPHLPVLASPCSLIRVDEATGLVLHDCVVGPGSSGAPLLIRGAEGYVLVGIQVAIVELDGRRVAAAVPLTTALPPVVFR